MNTNIATDRSQSARLLKCGVTADTADMMWSRLDETRDHSLYAVPWYTPRLPNRKITDNDFPAWSLSALLGLLFKSGHILSMQFERNEYRLQSFYSSGDFVTYGITAIEACVNMVEILTSHGYKLNEQ